MSVIVEVGRAASGGLNWNAISAIATTFAVFVALLVGVMPIYLADCRRKRQAKVLAQVLADDLFIQETHVRGAIKVPRGPDGKVTAWEYEQIAKATGLLNPQAVVEFIAFSPNLPTYVVNPLAQCAAMLQAAEQRRLFVDRAEPSRMHSVAGDIRWYESVADDIHKLREALHKWIGTDLQDFGDSDEVLARNFRSIAAEQRLHWQREQASRSTGRSDIKK